MAERRVQSSIIVVGEHAVTVDRSIRPTVAVHRRRRRRSTSVSWVVDGVRFEKSDVERTAWNVLIRPFDANDVVTRLSRIVLAHDSAVVGPLAGHVNIESTC